MNISRLTILSSTLAIAMMTLGYNPSFANKPTNGEHDHGDGDGGTETTFSVEVVTKVKNGLNTSGECVGTSTPSQHLTVSYFIDDLSDCGPVWITKPGGGSIEVYLLHIATKQTKKGDTVSIFFTEKTSPFAGNEWEWNSDPLPVTIDRDPDGYPAGSVLITEINFKDPAGDTAFYLTKTHQPNKRDKSTAEGITVGQIIYTPTSSE